MSARALSGAAEPSASPIEYMLAEQRRKEQEQRLRRTVIRVDEQEYSLPIAESAADQHPLPRAVDTLCTLMLLSAAAATCTLYYRATTPRAHFAALGFMFWMPSTAVFVMFHRLRMSEQRIRLMQSGDLESTIYTPMSSEPVYAFWCYVIAFLLYSFVTINPHSDHMGAGTIIPCVFFFIVSFSSSVVFLVRFKRSIVVADV